jgi:adenosylcobinamide-GDP ribazoletransferase
MPMPDNLIEDCVSDLTASLGFLTRLPLARATPAGGADIGRAAWAFPIAGIVVGLIGALVYTSAYKLGLSAWPAAALSIVATLMATGCLHEDGLADTADGFGGGGTREQKLDIMRDSRIGTYGVCALILSILIRAAALAKLNDPSMVAMALIAAHGAARATLPAFMALVPPARDDGLSHAAGRPEPDRAMIAGGLGIVILALFLGPLAGIAALILLAAAVVAMAWLSLRLIGGQTGDVIGALEQVGEVVIVLVALH